MKSNIEIILYSLIAILFIAISAQLAINLPESISAIPITGQSFAVLLLAHLLKGRWASLICVAYLLLGILGLPVFSDYSSGLAVFTGPSMGYLIGFAVAAYLIGNLAKKQDHQAKNLFIQMILGNLIILSIGFLGLLRFLNPAEAFSKGVQPFLLGAFIKSLLALLFLFVYYKMKALMSNKAQKLE